MQVSVTLCKLHIKTTKLICQNQVDTSIAQETMYVVLFYRVYFLDSLTHYTDGKICFKLQDGYQVFISEKTIIATNSL